MADADWRGELDGWLEPFRAAAGHAKRRLWAPAYLQGLIGPGERKSLRPMAAGLGFRGHDQLRHFVTSATWDDTPLRRLLVERADGLVGGPDAVSVIDDTALPKQGKLSVGVARQYCGCLGERANCQVLVSLTLARGEVPVPVGLRLFPPEAWAGDAGRCARAGVPEGSRRALAKAGIALAEIDRVLAAGARFGRVAADAGHGASAEFRQGLSVRGLTWAVGVLKTRNVYPPGVGLLWPAARTGRPRKHPVPSEGPVPAEQALAGAAWRRVSRRRGTKGPLAAAFAAVRVRPAEGAQLRDGRHLPGEGWEHSSRRAGGRAPRLGRDQAPPVQPAGRGGARGAGVADQGAVGVRAGAPAAQGGAGPRPLRGPLLGRAAPARPDGDDRPVLPPAPPARAGRQAGGRAARSRQDHRRGRPCPPSGTGRSSGSASP